MGWRREEEEEEEGMQKWANKRLEEGAPVPRMKRRKNGGFMEKGREESLGRQPKRWQMAWR
jgi:hypothetical protein